ncbi:Cysteine-rich CPXCG [Solimonas aquatica]|uniref:Cysteine-rich CPXCG n=1 Tax=Solimonas aquatica TaxID=489703 RepID=A0A1H9J6C8_9GAMM|nr:CPXCG motif-containing cysteine-rich protein [Solimonas aquatica]SEQ82175.1 Cysteine-rich CPXCG [Solimonas aquatica]
MLEEVTVTCPACWEAIQLDIDLSAGEVQDYTEDCPVCCRPMAVHVQLGEEGELPLVDVSPESE